MQACQDEEDLRRSPIRSDQICIPQRRVAPRGSKKKRSRIREIRRGTVHGKNSESHASETEERDAVMQGAFLSLLSFILLAYDLLPVKNTSVDTDEQHSKV